MVSELKERILQKQVEDFEEWLVIEKGIERSTATLYKQITRKFLKEVNTLLPNEKQAGDYRNGMLLNGKKQNYVANIVKAIRHYGRFAGIELKVKYPPETQENLPEYLTEQELRQMLFACNTARDQAIIQLMAMCGLRPCEIVRLRISDIDFDKSIVRVNTTKTRNVWELPISGDLAEILHHYIRFERKSNTNDETLFLNHLGKPRSNNTHCLNKLIKRIARRSGITRRVHSYTLRHTFATLLTVNGCPLPYTQRLMRHRSFKTTLRYAHVVDKSLSEIYQRYAPLRVIVTSNDIPIQNNPIQNAQKS